MKFLSAILAALIALYEAIETALLEKWTQCLANLRPRGHGRHSYTQTDPRLSWSPSPKLIKTFRATILVLSVSLIGFAAYGIWEQTTHSNLDAYHPLFVALGKTAGKTTHDLAPYGSRAVVILPDMSTGNTRFRTTVLRAFRDSLTCDDAVKLTGTWSLPPANSIGTHNLTARHLTDIIQQFDHPAVIVSFIGTPEFADDELSHWTAGYPTLVVIDTDRTQTDLGNLQTLLDRRIVSAAIVGQDKKPIVTPHPDSSAEQWFQSHFVVVTPESTASP